MAQDFYVDDIGYNIISDTEFKVEVCEDTFYGYDGTIIIPQKVTWDGIEYSVTCIGKKPLMNVNT